MEVEAVEVVADHHLLQELPQGLLPQCKDRLPLELNLRLHNLLLLDNLVSDQAWLKAPLWELVWLLDLWP